MSAALEWLRDPTDFISFLRSAGLKIGSGEALRVAAAFERFESAGRPPVDVDTALSMLTPLLATTVAEQRALKGLIDAYAGAFDETPESSPKQRATRPSIELPPVREPKITTVRFWMSSRFWLIVAVVLIFVVGARLLFVLLSLPGKVDDETVTSAVDLQAIGRLSDFVQPLLSIMNQLGGVHWAGLPLLAWLMFRQWNRMRPSPLRRLARHDSIRSLLRPESALPPLFGQIQLRRPLQALRSHRREATNNLDMSSSVRATAGAGGRTTLIYASRNRLPDYPIVIEQLSSNDHLAIVGRALSARMREERVEHALYTYSADPRRLRDASNSHVRPRDLAARHGEETLLLVSDGASLIDGLSGALRPAARSFLSWKDPVILTPVPLDAWSQREQLLSEAGFIVLPATMHGLEALGEFSRQGEVAARPEADARLSKAVPMAVRSLSDEWHREDPPPRDEIDRLMADLALHLPGSAFDLLCVLAIFPDVRVDLTIAAGLTFKQRDGRSFLNDESFAALAWLPWFRIGRIPEWLRIELIQCIPPARIDESRAFYVNWLLGAERSPQDGAIQLEQTPSQQLTREAARDSKSPLRDAILLRLDQGVPPASDGIGERHSVAMLLHEVRLAPEYIALFVALAASVVGFISAAGRSSSVLSEPLWTAGFALCATLSIASWHMRALDVGLERAPLAPLALATGAWLFLCLGKTLPIYEIGFAILALAPVGLALVDSKPRRTPPLKWIKNQRLSYLQALVAGIALAAITRITILWQSQDLSPSFLLYAALLSVVVAVWFAKSMRERALPLIGFAFVGSIASVFLGLIGVALFGVQFPSALTLAAAVVGSVYGACIALWTRGRTDLNQIFRLSMLALAALFLAGMVLGYVVELEVRTPSPLDGIHERYVAVGAAVIVSCYLLLVHVLFKHPEKLWSRQVWVAVGLLACAGVAVEQLLNAVFSAGPISLPFVALERHGSVSVRLVLQDVSLIPVLQVLMVPAAVGMLSRRIHELETKPQSVTDTAAETTSELPLARVVRILAKDVSGYGLIISNDTVLTVDYLLRELKGADDVQVSTLNGGWQAARVERRDGTADLALLRVEVPFENIGALAHEYRAPMPRAPVVAIAAESGLRAVSGFLMDDDEGMGGLLAQFEHFAVLLPGTPVFDAQGHFVGLTQMRSMDQLIRLTPATSVFAWLSAVNKGVSDRSVSLDDDKSEAEAWLTRAWLLLQALLLALSFNAMSLTQGWGIEWPLTIAAGSRTTYQWAPLMLSLWIPLSVALMIVTSELMRRRGHRPAWDRVPVLLEFPNSLRDPFFLRLRKAVVVGSAVACLYVGWHLLRKTTKAIVYCDGSVVADSTVAHFTQYVSPLIAFGSGPRCRLDGIRDGVTYFAFWQSWIALIALTVITFIWIRALVRNASPVSLPAASQSRREGKN